MVQTNEEDISFETVLSLHKETIASDKTNEEVVEIINALGGIDKILDDYLTSLQSQISSQKLFMIHQILSSSKSFTSKVTNFNPYPHFTKSDMNLEDNNDPNNTFYTFSDKDTFLHCYFGNKNAERVISILQNKFLQLLIILSIFLYMYFRQTSWSNIFSIYIVVVNILLWIPFAVGWVLSCNIKGFKLITNTFEFWFKVLYAVACGVLQIYYYGYHKNEPTIGLTGIGFMAFDVIGIVAVISLYDAIHIKAIYKISISGFVGMLFTFVAIVTQLSIDPATDDSVVNIPLLRPVRRISLWMLIISTWRVLAIFSWKQAISTYLATRNSQNKSVFISNSPSIRWNATDVSAQIIGGSDGDEDYTNKAKMEDLEEKNIPTEIPNTKIIINLSQESNIGNDGLEMPSWNIVSSGSANSINSAVSSGSTDSNMIHTNQLTEHENDGIRPQRSVGGIPIQWHVDDYDDTEMP